MKQIKQLDPQEADSVFRIEPIAMRKGRLQGRKEGMKEKEIEHIHAMLREGADIDFIAKIVSLPVEEIEEIKQQRQYLR